MTGYLSMGRFPQASIRYASVDRQPEGVHVPEKAQIDEASSVTGAVIHVDGGASVGR